MIGKPSAASLTGRRVLVAEDEYLLADEIASEFAALGITIVGPAATLARAMHLVDSCGHLDGALLDINLHGEMVFAVADALRRRRVPFVFVTGYDQRTIPARYADVPRHEKPVDPAEIVRALFR